MRIQAVQWFVYTVSMWIRSNLQDYFREIKHLFFFFQTQTSKRFFLIFCYLRVVCPKSSGFLCQEIYFHYILCSLQLLQIVVFTGLVNIAEVFLPCADKVFRKLWLEAGVQHLPQDYAKVWLTIQTCLE